jgi:hypothetical protein
VKTAIAPSGERTIVRLRPTLSALPSAKRVNT